MQGVALVAVIGTRALAAGVTPETDSFVGCDATTTQADIDRGAVNIVVGFAPPRPAEFAVLNIAQIAGGAPA